MAERIDLSGSADLLEPRFDDFLQRDEILALRDEGAGGMVVAMEILPAEQNPLWDFHATGEIGGSHIHIAVTVFVHEHVGRANLRFDFDHVKPAIDPVLFVNVLAFAHDRYVGL
jgi:hypothetical protein